MPVGILRLFQTGRISNDFKIFRTMAGVVLMVAGCSRQAPIARIGIEHQNITFHKSLHRLETNILEQGFGLAPMFFENLVQVKQKRFWFTPHAVFVELRKSTVEFLVLGTSKKEIS